MDSENSYSNTMSTGRVYNYDELSDEQLMLFVTEGDTLALEKLYDRYAAAVMGLALSILQDTVPAEEVVQETFWRVWSHAHSFRPQSGPFANWLSMIAYFLTTARRQRNRPWP